MKSLLFGNVKYIRAVKCWLVGMLFFIPFQLNIARIIKEWNIDMATYMRYLEEITIVVFLPLALIEFYRNRKTFNKIYFVILLPIILLSISGLKSGIMNGNLYFITILGVFDYLKIILNIFIYAAFFRDLDDFKKVFKYLLTLAVFIVLIAIIQEVYVLVSIYILGKDKMETGIYILRTNVSTDLIESYWRLGIYRATSLLHHSAYLGFFCLLIITLYLSLKKKWNLGVIISLFAGIVLCVSRVVYIGFMIVLWIGIFRGKKRIMVLLVPIIIGLAFMSALSDFNLLKTLNLPVLKNIELKASSAAGTPFRVYTRDKSLEIWKDYPFWGVGPGMFGGVISIKFNSHVYNEYNFIKHNLFNRTSGIDQFWPRLIAEMGIIGFMIYIYILLSVFITLIILSKNSSVEYERNLLAGLAIFIIPIIIWGNGVGLNNFVLYIYYALLGMGIGIATNNDGCSSPKDHELSG